MTKRDELKEYPTDSELLELISQGEKAAESFNQWRKKYLKERLIFTGWDFSNMNLQGANLYKVDFRKADLSKANLAETNLCETDLREANLGGADLRGAELVGANLGRANLTKANLYGADLRLAQLILTNLCQANVTGAKFYGTSRDDWKIDGIQCDYVYWDREGKQRIPENIDFQREEFEELYKNLPKFEYVFKHGVRFIDIAIINQIINDIQELHPEWELKIDSFQAQSQPRVVFSIISKDFIVDVFKQIKNKYEAAINKLKGDSEASNRMLLAIVKEFTNKPQLMITGGEITMGDKHIARDNIEITGNAHVTNFRTGTGDSFQGDYARKLLQDTTPQSPKMDIVELLSFVQQELPKLPMPNEVKEEVSNEVKGAEIQAQKKQVNKRKIAEKLKNATEALKESAQTAKEAIEIGNLLGKAIILIKV